MITLRQLQEGNWTLLRDIRLKGLKSDPGVFGSNFQKESAMTESDWRGWLTNSDSGIFGVFSEDDIIGMTGIAIYKDDPSGKTAILWGSWLEPPYRSKGVSQLMYQTRIDWARKHPVCEKIVVSHRASNVASGKANQKHGFVFTHKETKEWPDGQADDHLFYELKLNKVSS
jgi:RimJ/RimL family protein N-acetyltransferase